MQRNLCATICATTVSNFVFVLSCFWQKTNVQEEKKLTGDWSETTFPMHFKVWTHGNSNNRVWPLLFSHPLLFEEDYSAGTSISVEWGPRHMRQTDITHWHVAAVLSPWLFVTAFHFFVILSIPVYSYHQCIFNLWSLYTRNLNLKHLRINKFVVVNKLCESVSLFFI